MTGLPEAALHRLTYLSSARDDIPPSELVSILETARDNNRRRHVTGLLLYHDMQFFQTLEGPKAHVDEIFAAIKADRRHSGCLILESRSVAARCFDGWSMGYRRAADLDASQKENFRDLTSIRGRYAGSEPNDHSRTRILIDSFLSSFRDLELP